MAPNGATRPCNDIMTRWMSSCRSCAFKFSSLEGLKETFQASILCRFWRQKWLHDHPSDMKASKWPLLTLHDYDILWPTNLPRSLFEGLWGLNVINSALQNWLFWNLGISQKWSSNAPKGPWNHHFLAAKNGDVQRGSFPKALGSAAGETPATRLLREGHHAATVIVPGHGSFRHGKGCWRGQLLQLVRPRDETKANLSWFVDKV